MENKVISRFIKLLILKLNIPLIKSSRNKFSKETTALYEDFEVANEQTDSSAVSNYFFSSLFRIETKRTCHGSQMSVK